MTTRWILNEPSEVENAKALSEALQIHPILASILIDRGIKTEEGANKYFNPSLNDLYDPFLMKGMSRAIKRLQKAMQSDEKILIYGDYDVDGTTSVALVYGFLRHFYANIDYYIPDRYKEGYGISKAGIEWASENEFTLILTLDCGIKAVEMTRYAATKGIEMIICDHHLPGDELPEAYAILDPKQIDCPYPYKELSGCGLGFKLIQAFCHENHYDPDLLYDYLDLVVVSIASDIVPITDENRILAYHGLKKLNSYPRAGLEALIEGAGIRDEINITSIVFGIGPRINASGRMDHAKNAVDLLLTDKKTEADKYAGMLDTKNSIRRNYDATITMEALLMIENDEILKAAKSTVLFQNHWHKGVIGIVASRCLDKFYRPTIILTESNGKATGSARSVTGFDLYEAISECSDLLDQFGGHMYAAGLTMDIQNIEAFKQKFEEVVARKITDEQLIPQIGVDAHVRLSDFDEKFYETLCRIAPFGPGNLQPVFMSDKLKISGRPRVLKDMHLKFCVQQDDSDVVFDVIAFGQAQYADLVGSGMQFSMAYYLEENNYNGKTTLQLRAKDIKFD
ncbi:MAG: single-stranded-DNA-specific exonuclease RecJ [Cyclobacteriaceae bacterium]